MKVVGPFINIASLIFLKVISPQNVFTVIKSSFFDVSNVSIDNS